MLAILTQPGQKFRIVHSDTTYLRVSVDGGFIQYLESEYGKLHYAKVGQLEHGVLCVDLTNGQLTAMQNDMPVEVVT